MQLPGAIQRRVDAFGKSKPGTLIRVYSECDVPTWAVVIAYSTMFSMFPILLGVLAIVGFVLRDPATFVSALDRLQALFPGAADRIADAAIAARDNAGTLGPVSFVALIWAGSGLFGAIAHGINKIYGVADRSLLWQRLMGAAMVFVFSILFVLSLGAASAAQFTLERTSSALGFVDAFLSVVSTIVSIALSLATAFVLFSAIHWIVPNVRLRFRQMLPGAMFGAVAFVVLSQAFSFYARSFGNFNQYGVVFGLFFLLMTWFWLLGQVILFGAGLNRVLHPDIVARSAVRPPQEREQARAA